MATTCSTYKGCFRIHQTSSNLSQVCLFTDIFIFKNGGFFRREMAPGQRECDRAIGELRVLFQEVDKALTNVETLRKTDKSLQVNFSHSTFQKILTCFFDISFIKNKFLPVHIFSLNSSSIFINLPNVKPNVLVPMSLNSSLTSNHSSNILLIMCHV